MASRKTLLVGAGVAVLAVAGVALAAQHNHEANENRIIGEHSEKHIALDQVPQPAMAAARTKMATVREAELVTRKADGSTLYEFEGKDQAGKKVEMYVTPTGEILGGGGDAE